MLITNDHANEAYSVRHSPATSPATSGSSDYQTFLKMLTTQITHQDPLNPMEGSDFAVQLATFSGVEQQAQTNKILQSVFGSNGPDEVAKFSNLLGRKVLSIAPVYFSGDQVEIVVPKERGEGPSFLIAKDAHGREVSRSALTAGNERIVWPDSNALLGQGIDSGYYSFHVEALGEDGQAYELVAGHYSNVIGVEATKEGAQLVLEGDVKIHPREVLAIRS